MYLDVCDSSLGCVSCTPHVFRVSCVSYVTRISSVSHLSQVSQVFRVSSVTAVSNVSRTCLKYFVCLTLYMTPVLGVPHLCLKCVECQA